jgi:hypothetical protein
MSTTDVIAIICYGLATLVAFVFCAIYLTRSEFMPYHGDAVELPWSEVDSKHQILILALMRASGGGWLATGISMAFLLAFPFRSGETWSVFALPLVGLSAAISTLYAALFVKKNSQANPPAGLVGAAILSILLGFVLSIV